MMCRTFRRKTMRLGRTHFATYLVDRGVICAEQALQALDAQRARQQPIGQICVERGYLSIRAAFDLLNAQLEDPRPFGDLAVGHGLMSAEQRDNAVALQKSTRPRLGEVMVDLGFFAQAQLVCVLQDYFSEGNGAFVMAAEAS
jgi:hypothetical protein